MAVGGRQVCVIAGPCAVESEKQIMEAAEAVRKAGRICCGVVLTSREPLRIHSRHEREGTQAPCKAGKMTGLPIVTEVVNPETAELVAEYADVLQIGTRNSQNFELLKKIGKLKKRCC